MPGLSVQNIVRVESDLVNLANRLDRFGTGVKGWIRQLPISEKMDGVWERIKSAGGINIRWPEDREEINTTGDKADIRKMSMPGNDYRKRGSVEKTDSSLNHPCVLRLGKEIHIVLGAGHVHGVHAGVGSGSDQHFSISNRLEGRRDLDIHEISRIKSD